MGTAREDFVEFVAHRSAPLLRTAYLLCGGDQGAAEDLPQDVLERACPRWQRITGPPVAYLRAALANMATNRRRARSRRIAVTADQQDRVLNVTYGGVVDPANPLPGLAAGRPDHGDRHTEGRAAADRPAQSLSRKRESGPESDVDSGPDRSCASLSRRVPCRDARGPPGHRSGRRPARGSGRTHPW